MSSRNPAEPGPSSRCRLAIIADDLTGASDSGVQLSRIGLRTAVLLDAEDVGAYAARYDVLVCDTDSRTLPPREAYERARLAARKLKEAGFERLYKKIDSTLRGNLGAEIDAVLDVYGYDLAAVAPAFPRTGRVTLDGVQLLHGVPVHETELASDPSCPVAGSDLQNVLREQSSREVGVVTVDTVRAGADALASRVCQLAREGVRVVVFDAESDEDLRCVARALAGLDALWVGSAGLAEHLPEVLDLPVGSSPTFTVLRSGAPVLLVAGSLSEVTREQVRRFRYELGALSVEMDPSALTRDESRGRSEVDLRARELGRALREGGAVLLHIPIDTPNTSEAVDARCATAKVVADALGEVTSKVLGAHRLQGLILTGGDTARAVCRHLGTAGIQPIREVEPGVPLGKLLDTDLPVVTKAGAFGTRDTLVRAARALKGEC